MKMKTLCGQKLLIKINFLIKKKKTACNNVNGIKIYLKDHIRIERGNFKEIVKICVV